jgi:hypothetical protein
MPRKIDEILFTTDVPVNIIVRRDNTSSGRWYIASVSVQDTDVDLDPKRVRAYDAVNDVELTRTIDAPEHPKPVRDALASAFKALEGGQWPAWTFGD